MRNSVANHRPTRTARQFGLSALVDGILRRPERIVAVIVILGLLLVPLITGSSFLATIAQIVAFDSVLALTATLLVGYGGQFSFAFPVFVGVGAYVSTWLTLHTGVPLPLVLVAAGVCATAVGLVLSYGALQIRGLQLGILTLGFCLSGVEIFTNVGGANGIGGIPPMYIGGLAMVTPYLQLLVYVAVLIVAYIIVSLLVHRRFGRLLLLLKADEDTASSLGLDVARHKRVTFVIHALLLGLLGGFYPLLLGYVGSDLFPLNLGLDIFFGAVLGGLLFPEGAIVGSLLFSVVPLVAGTQNATVEPLLYGVLLLVVLIVLPSGLLGLLPRRRSKRGSETLGRPSDAMLSAPAVVAGAAPVANGFVDQVQEHSSEVTSPAPVRATDVPALRLEHLRKSFGGLQAIKDVSLEVAPGEIVGLIGNNGAGKSTLINLTCGFLKPDGGRVLFGGEDISRWSSDRRARAGIQRTFQFPTMIGELTVSDNLRVGAEARRPYGRVDASVPDITERTLALLGLEALGDTPVSELSLGLQKVVDVARALMTSPRVLLLDEPAAGLSLAELPVMAAALKLARDEGLSLVIVEHNVPFVLDLVDKVVVLDFGSVLTVGSPQDIVKDEAVMEAYLGRPAGAR